MIALVGSDGAGKSTICHQLHTWLRFKLDVHSFYMGSGDGGTHPVDLLRRCIRSIVKSVKGGSKRRPQGTASVGDRKANGGFGKFIELYQLAIMHRKITMLRSGRTLVHGGSIALTDRYPQEQFPGISDGPKIQGKRSYAWAAERELDLYQQAKELGPDLVINLKVSPEVAVQRKPDHDVAAIAKKIEIVEALKFPQARVVAVDTTEPLDVVLLATKRAIWAELIRKCA